MKLLIFGPKYQIENFASSGGGAVLFENFLFELKQLNIEYDVIDTNKNNYSNRLVAYVSILKQFIFQMKTCNHISIHGTYADYILIAPILIFLTKFTDKTVSTRKFAGNLIDLYKASNRISKFLLKYVLINSDINFFETKYLVDAFKKYNKSTYWFPNVRRAKPFQTTNTYNKKFIFVGHVWNEKGIDILCKTSNLLSSDYQIDIYGVLKDNYTKASFYSYNVSYKGILKPESVVETMKNYDVLVLPSLREGYPGVIIEGLSVGLPIIATNLDGIKEMVNENCAILVKPKNTLQLKEGMKSFSMENYTFMSKKAKEQFQLFDSAIQTKIFLERIISSC